MQFCGFAGTQWPVSDNIATELAQAFYRDLFRGENMGRLTYSAAALHTSLMLLNERKKPVELLVPFIHVDI